MTRVSTERGLRHTKHILVVIGHKFTAEYLTSRKEVQQVDIFLKCQLTEQTDVNARLPTIPLAQSTVQYPA
jgi:hypothetical protein